MASFVLWYVAVELLGLAALPLAMAALPRLADRGYGLAKVLGILLVTYLNYVLGSALGLGNNVALLAVGMAALCAVGVLALGLGPATAVAWQNTPTAVGGARTTAADVLAWFKGNAGMIAVQEGLFLVLFVAWTLFRAAHPAILSTEKPMDLALMTAAHRATAFPPYDPWLSGHAINYYYGGYLAVGTLVTLTGVAPAVGYNLAVALLFALVGTAAYSVAYGLVHDLRWAALGPLFVLLVGNLDGLAQLLDPAHGINGFDFFRSSRVVEAGNTINEFPAFSFLLGDLHPHVIALPFTILAIGVALNLALAPAAGWAGLGPTELRGALTLLVAGLDVGALYFMNSWDWPTYALLCGAALLVPGLRTLARRPLAEAVGLAVGLVILSAVLYLAFRLTFNPQYSSFGLRAHGSPTGQVLTMFGLFLLPVAAFIVGRFSQGEGVAPAAPAPAPAPQVAAGAAPGAASQRATGRRKGGTAVLERDPAPDEEPIPDAEAGSAEDELPQLPTLRLPRRKRAAQRGAGGGASGVDREPAHGDNVVGGDDELPRLPMPSLPGFASGGGGALALVAAAVVLWALFGVAGGMGVTGLLLPFALVAVYLAWRAARAERPHEAVALLLCAGGIGLIILCDVLYFKDNFCGLDASGSCAGTLYRMNTVFKFYYQAWTLLALGGAYGLYYLATRLRAGWPRLATPAAAAVIVLAGGVYTVLGIVTATTNVYTVPVAHAAPTLDGSAYLDAYSGLPAQIRNAIPADAAAIRWLRAHVPGHPAVLEADRVPGPPPGPQDYWPFPGYPTQELMMSRISTFTGLPAVLGWGYSHEGLWHGDAIVAQRFNDVQTMYTSTSAATVGALLRAYNVGYVYVGQVEAYTYYNDDPALVRAALARFERFGKVVYTARGVTIIRTSF